MRPTVSGYYWLRTARTHMVSKDTLWDMAPEIVYVSMEATRRTKVVAQVFGRGWSEKLERYTDANSRWHGPLLPPSDL